MAPFADSKQTPRLGTVLGSSAAMALLWLLVCLAITWKQPTPAPAVHDEFSYLLQADTFAHGRLANPPHPLGVFFESPHILIRPTYASKYPPGQSMWLALGQILFSSPWAGVLMQMTSLIFVLCAMLCTWSNLRWALIVTALAGFYLLPPHYWTVSYMGGGAAALGSALVLLGVGRLLHGGRPWIAGFLAGLGAVELMFTRPYEGGAFCLSVALATLWLSRHQLRTLLRPMAIALAVISVGIAGYAVYNRAVTGQARLLPYVLHDRTYNTTPVLWPMPLRPEPQYSGVRLAAQHGTAGWEADSYRKIWDSPQTPLGAALWETARYFSPPLLAMLPMVLLLPAGLRSSRCRLILAMLLLCLLSVSLTVWHLLHYMAPTIIVLYLFAACCGQQASVPNPRISAATPYIAIAWSMIIWLVTWSDPSKNHFGPERAAVIQLLRNTPGDDLVIVRYPEPTACVKNEWVYNAADIDAQPVVFAHDRGPGENARLFDYYKNRRQWLLTASCDSHQLEPLKHPKTL